MAVGAPWVMRTAGICIMNSTAGHRRLWLNVLMLRFSCGSTSAHLIGGPDTTDHRLWPIGFRSYKTVSIGGSQNVLGRLQGIEKHKNMNWD